MTRQSKFTPGMDKTETLQAASPIVLSHQGFTGLGIQCTNAAAVMTVKCGLTNASFPDTITMNGGATAFRYPASAEMYKLNNAAFIQITWDVGNIRVFQKE